MYIKINRETEFRVWDKVEKRVILLGDLKEISLWARIHPEIDFDERYEFMQFTGLLDRGWKKIYEKDILKFEIMGYNEVGVIDFYDSGFWIKKPNGELHLPAKGYREVIGNIYENPELLK